jgi:hypothetical protein
MAQIRGATFRVEGMEELEAQLGRIGKMPKKYLNRAARAGADNSLAHVKANAPKGKTGILKKGIQKKMETPNKRKKSVYRIRWNPKYSESYNKPSSGAYGGKPPVAFYPYSQEYGFLNKSGGKTHTKWYHFAKKALGETEVKSAELVVKSLGESIDELTRGV